MTWLRRTHRTVARPLLAMLAVSSHALEPAPIPAVGSAVMPATAVPVPSLRSHSLTDASAVVIELPPLSVQEAAALADRESSSGSLRLGAGRPIPTDQATGEIGLKLNWQATPEGGHVAVIRVMAPGALGSRLAVRVYHLPDVASLRFFPRASMPVPEITGTTVNASLLDLRTAGVTGEAAETYWSPLIPGDTVTLEIALPTEVELEQVRVALPRLSHFFRWPFADASTPADDDPQDMACHPDWERQSRATALLLYTEAGGGSGVCTGTLLNDSDPATHVPYLLTAHHCVADPLRASSVQTYWFHRSDQCRDPTGQATALTGGADLLHAAKSTDTSLLRLRQPPPAGAVFAGWSATLPPIGTTLTGLHHPRGMRQRLTTGALSEYLNCADICYCGDGADPDAIHYLRVTWSHGVTEAGGSGSGVFLPSGELVGTLSGGFSRPHGPDDYGRFDIPYRAALYKWLGPGRSPSTTQPAKR